MKKPINISPVKVEKVDCENKIVIFDNNTALIMDGQATEILKKLKAFEIIKEKRVNVWLIQEVVDSVEEYNSIVDDEGKGEELLTQEEYALLKEELE